MAQQHENKSSHIFDIIKTACYQESQPHFWLIDSNHIILLSQVDSRASNPQEKQQSFFDFCKMEGLQNPIKAISFIERTASLKPISKWKNKNTIRYFKFQAQFTPNNNQCLLIAFDITQNIELDDCQLKLEFLQNIIDHLPYHFFWKDKNSQFLGCNKVFAEHAGLNNPDEIIGKTDYDLPWDKKNSDAYVLDDKHVIKSQTAKLNIEEYMEVDNESLVLLTSKVPLIRSGETIGIIGIFQDISERKKMENELSNAKSTAENALKAKSQLLATVSHELRTPLHGILGITQIIENSLEVIDIKGHTKDIKKLANSLLLLVNDLLNFTQFEKYEMAIHEDSFSCKELIESLVRQCTQSTQYSQLVNLQYDVDKNLPSHLIGDELRIQQILHNLVSNAYKFTHEGTISVQLELVEQINDTVKVRFSVHDTGIGIAEEHQQMIFQTFYQVNENETINGHKGVGLGLSICQQLCHRMGSQLLVNSHENMGAEFHFTLNLKIDNRANQKLEDTSSSNYTPVNKNIFVIEDDPINQKVIQYFLKTLGCLQACATSGEAAIKDLSDRPHFYDIILLDIGLPDINGLQLIQTIQNETSYRDTPFIILTAQVLENTETLISQYPSVKHILTKPVDIFEVRQAIENVGNKNN